MHWSQFITHNIMSFTPLAHAHNVLICCLIIKDCHLISAVHICQSHLSNSTLQHHLSSCSCLFKYNAHSAFIHSAILPTHPARIFFFLSFQHESLQIFNIHITFFSVFIVIASWCRTIQPVGETSLLHLYSCSHKAFSLNEIDVVVVFVGFFF